MKNLKNNLKIIQLLHLIVLFGAFSAINLFSMRMTERGKAAAQYFLKEQGLIKEKEAVKNKRGLLIFLDDAETMEDKLEAIGGSFLTALYQEAGPIIVSTSLLYALRELREKDTRFFEAILKEGEERMKEITPDPFKKNIIVLSRICFQPEQWIVKKINNTLNLLIPKSYLEPFGIIEKEVDDYDDAIGVTQVELKLGFMVNHMESITIEKLDKPDTKLMVFANYFI